MGEIRTNVLLQNERDLGLYDAGFITKNNIRKIIIDALVDTGAVEVLLPNNIVKLLGLKVYGSVRVTLANDKTINMKMAKSLMLSIGNRSMVTDCLVGPSECEPLIGQLVLERLDLIPDPRKKALAPRPESPDLPLLKMKCSLCI